MSMRTSLFRRWMALFLCVVMCVSLLPIGTALAEEGDAALEEAALSDVNDAAPAEVSFEEYLDAEPVVDAEPVINAEPVVDAEPVADAEPVVDAEPVETWSRL